MVDFPGCLARYTFLLNFRFSAYLFSKSLKQKHCILSFESNICWVLSAVLSHFSHVLLFVTLWTVDHQAPLSMGILQARILVWVAMPFSKGSSQTRDWTCASYISCIGKWVFLFVWFGFVFVLSLAPPGKLWYLVVSMHVHDYKSKLHGYWSRLPQWRR